MAIKLQGYVFKNDGTALSGATVQVYDTSDTSTEGTAVTSDSNGLWTYDDLDTDALHDVKISSGGSVRWRMGEDKIQIKEAYIRNDTSATQSPLYVANATNATSVKVLDLSNKNSTRADNDEIYISFNLNDYGGTSDEFARITAVATDVTAGEEDGALVFSVADNDNSGNLQEAFRISSSTGGTVSQTFTTDSFTIGTGGDTDVVLNFSANTASGVITWMEDEDYFKFSDEILMNSTEKILFGDTATFIHQSSDGVMTVDGEATIDLNASTAVLVSNDLKLNSDSAVLGFGADNDTTLTHTDGTGLTLNSTNKLTFGDTGTFIHQSSDGVLTITSDTTVDINGAVAFDGAITGATNITLSGELDAATLDISGNADIDGTLEADAITVDGTTLAEFVSDTVGAMVTSNTESGITVAYQDADNTLDFTVGTLNQDTTGTAAIATTVTITDNESTNESNAIIFTAGGDVDGGNIGLESDGTLTYNPSTGKITATGFIGALTGNADTATLATLATTLTITDNESTNENNAIIFTAGGDLDGGNLGLESDGDLYYNPSTGTLTVPVLTIGGTAIVAQSTTSAVGGVELATAAEITTSTSETLVMTAGLFNDSIHAIRYVGIVVADSGTALTTGDGKAYFHIPAGLAGMDLMEAHAEVNTAPVGSTIIIEVSKDGNSTQMLTTNLTIDAGETGSDSATAAAFATDGSEAVVENNLIQININQIGSSTAGSGLVVTLGFRIP